MSYINEVDKLIEKRLTFYRDYREQIIKDYNDELETSKEYKGRQLLELLQNVDDTGSKEAEITWNKTKKSLSIANKEEAFSLEGVNAVMQGHLSTKIKTHYIGNKGLGFRSLLNWARKINVYTNDCKISFSPAHAQKVFNEKLGLTESQKKELTQSRGLKDGSVLFPTLAIPEITEQKNETNWFTIVEINYEGDDIEKNIKSQLDQISEELLLFLNNINSIKINIEGQDEIIFTSKRIQNGTHTNIIINNKEWIVFEKKKILPQRFQDQNKTEQQAYQLKVAFQQDLSDRYYKLFNYFPTQLTVSLPCVIHGTFDLSSSRDHLNKSDVNIFIFKKLVKLLKKCSLFLTENKEGWEAFKLLTPKNYKSDSELVTDFYGSLEQVRNRIKICPTITGRYITLKKARYYNEDFSIFFRDNFPKTFPDLLEPMEVEFRNEFRDSKYPNNEFVSQIDGLSHNGMHIEQRAELIEQLVGLKYFGVDQRFSLLISQNEKQVISKNITTFTPAVRSDADFEIPNDVEVDFIHTELYDTLLSRFESKFEQSEKNEQKSRQLQRLIKDVVNLQPYDSNNVIDKIIGATNKVVKNNDDDLDKISLVKSMVKALFANFSNINTELEVVGNTVYLLNKNNEVAEASTLFLSNSYPNGKRVEEIYNGVLTENDYLTDFADWNLLTDDLDKVASFFLWLGVNEYVVKGIDELYGLKLKQEYMDRLFSKSIPKPQDFSINKIQSGNKVKHIKNIEQINSLEINKLLLLVLSDRFIKEELELYNEKIVWKHHINYSLQATISYLQFQFLHYDKFSTQIIGESSEGINSLLHKQNFIDFEMMATYGFEEYEVKSILLKLGAKQSINEFSADALYELLNIISSKFSKTNVRGVQNMYHLIVEALSHNTNLVPVPDDLLLFAQRGEVIELLPPSKIYYSSNSILPKKIEDTIPMLLFSKRRNQENLKQYLGVQIIDASQLVVKKDKEINDELNVLFQQRFESLKPAILTYRLFSKNLRKPVAKADSKTSGVEPLKKCNLILVNHCTYAYGDREDVELDDFDFVVDGDTYYLKVTKLNSLEELLKESNFSDAFAEIMSIQFKISELKNDFRFLIRNDLNDTKHLIHSDFAKEDLNAIQHYFGIAKAEMTFWKQVYIRAQLDYPERILKQAALIGQLEIDLGIKLKNIYPSVDFVGCTSQESYKLLKVLVSKYGLKINDLYPDGIQIYHSERLRNLRESKEQIVKSLLWQYLNRNKSDQSKFLFFIDAFKQPDTVSLFQKEDSFRLEVDCLGIFKNFIKRTLPISLADETSINIKIDNLYRSLLVKYSIDINDIKDEIKSLLYFPGNEIAIQEYLKNMSQEYSDDSIKDKARQNTEKEDSAPLSFINASLEKRKLKLRKDKKPSKNKRGVHSKRLDKLKDISGKNAEIDALKAFKNQYESVKWVSGYSDTSDSNDNLHYDISYEDDNGVWKHVEVKSLSSDNSFILTQSEKQHGIKNKDIYEFALVSKSGIYRVFSPLSFEDGKSFEYNESFTAVAKDYSLNFNIKKV